MKNSIINILFALMVSISLQGCSFFNIGEPQGVCEENGCDYSDAGQCGDVLDLYRTRYSNLDKSYENISCNDCKDN